jgi:hypothetical protein
MECPAIESGQYLSDVDEIEQTIKNPDYITQDAIDDERLVYYRTYRRRP